MLNCFCLLSWNYVGPFWAHRRWPWISMAGQLPEPLPAHKNAAPQTGRISFGRNEFSNCESLVVCSSRWQTRLRWSWNEVSLDFFCINLRAHINHFGCYTRKDFVSSTAYSNSKLAQVMFTKSLQRSFDARGARLQIHSVHPGVVNTDLFKDTYIDRLFPWMPKLLFKVRFPCILH